MDGSKLIKETIDKLRPKMMQAVEMTKARGHQNADLLDPVEHKITVDTLKTWVNTNLRYKTDGRVYWYMWAVTIALYMLLLMQGFKFQNFSLATPILVTLAGGMTVSAVGLVGFMVKGLFTTSTEKEGNNGNTPPKK